MIPDERELAKELAAEPFTFLGINSDQSRSALKDAMTKEQITWPNIYDGAPGQGAIGKKWGVHSWPTIYVIDHEGVIRHVGLRGEALAKAVRELVAKAPRKS